MRDEYCGPVQIRPVQIRAVEYDDPHVQLFVDQIQGEYARIYGAGDDTDLTADTFHPVMPGSRKPLSTFFVGYEGAEPVTMGGWRLLDADLLRGDSPGTAKIITEVKRMYVAPGYRRRGLARDMLRHLERDAASAGAEQMLIMTGQRQPAAVALYRSEGYSDVDGHGWSQYVDSEFAVHLGKALR